MSATKRTAHRPRFEPMEDRTLRSGLMIALQPHIARPDVITAAETIAVRAQATSPLSSQSGNGLFVGATGPNAGVQLPASPLLGQGTPTTRELAREKFVARFAGPMAVLPPRFSDQSKIIYLHGLGSSPRFFLHGDYTLGMVFPSGFNPKNPTASPTVTGFAFLDDKNNNNSATLGLDLSADPTSFDSKGRPTRFFFTSDPNIYSGTFYVTQSSGTVTIRYGKTTAAATFDGRLYTTGLTSTIQNSGLYAQG